MRSQIPILDQGSRKSANLRSIEEISRRWGGVTSSIAHRCLRSSLLSSPLRRQWCSPPLVRREIEILGALWLTKKIKRYALYKARLLINRSDPIWYEIHFDRIRYGTKSEPLTQPHLIINGIGRSCWPNLGKTRRTLILCIDSDPIRFELFLGEIEVKLIRLGRDPIQNIIKYIIYLNTDLILQHP